MNAVRVLILAALALLAACAAPPLPAAPRTPTPATGGFLHLVSTQWPPFTDVEGKDRVAFSLVHSALERAGYGSATQVLPSATYADALRSSKYDGSPATWRNKDREQYLLYSKPYLENRLVIVGKAGSDVSAKAFSDLKGKRIGIQEGFAYGETLDDARDPIFVRSASLTESFQALGKGEVDYVLIDALVLQYLFDEDAARAKQMFAVGEHTLLNRGLHLTVRKDFPQAQSVIDSFDAEIAKMMRDGSYNRLLEVTWVEVDVDGDGKNELVLAGSAAGKIAPEHGYKPLTTSVGPEPAPHASHFFIDGKLYNSWDQVPEEYKSQPSPDLKRPKTVNFDVVHF
ncbi:MAG: transporter substrate-binding domain-containing protein [Polyangiaceae bacterium]